MNKWLKHMFPVGGLIDPQTTSFFLSLFSPILFLFISSFSYQIKRTYSVYPTIPGHKMFLIIHTYKGIHVYFCVYPLHH